MVEIWDSIIRLIIKEYNVNKYQVFEMGVIEFLNDATTCKKEILKHNKRVAEQIKEIRKHRRRR